MVGPLMGCRVPPVQRWAPVWALVAALWSGRALGAPSPATLAVDRADDALDCPDRAGVESGVERILRQPVTTAGAPGEAPIRVEVRFARRRTEYTALIRLSAPKEGERILDDPGPTCTAL